MSVTAIIGGTGFDNLDDFHVLERHVVETPFGKPSDKIAVGMLYDRQLLFLARHGATHSIPPHLINYRANIHALKTWGATRIIAFAAVGAIDTAMIPGDVVIPDQILDYTWGRKHTFFDGIGAAVQHVDFTHPYSQNLRSQIIQGAKRSGVRVHQFGTYAACQGPRLESAAEIDRLQRDGAHVVGMTGMPEAALAKEAGIEYATIAIVVNPAAGRASGPITMDIIRVNLKLGVLRGLAILQYC